MTNQVDVSAEIIEGEWARLIEEHEAGDIPMVEKTDEGMKFQKEPEPEAQKNQLNVADKVASAELVILGGLRFVFNAIGGLKISDNDYKKMANAWAVVIAERFEGGIFEFLGKYRAELNAIVATLVFLGAVRAGVAEKRAELEAAKEKVSDHDEA